MLVEYLGRVVGIFTDSVGVSDVLMNRTTSVLGSRREEWGQEEERTAHLVAQILKTRVPGSTLPSPSLVSVDQEIQQVNGLYHVIEHWPIALRRDDGIPSCLTGHPDPNLSVRMLTVGVVSHIVDDDPFGEVVFIKDCEESARKSAHTKDA